MARSYVMAEPRPKGLILSGGSDPPVANRPLVSYGLEAMRRAGIRQVGIVAGQRSGDAVRAAGEQSHPGLEVHLLPGEGSAGPAESLAAAASFLRDSPCIVQLRNGLVRGDMAPLLEELDRDRLDALLLLDPSGADGDGVTGIDDRRLMRLAGEESTSARLAGVHVLGPRVAREARAGEGLSDLLARVTAGGGRARTRTLAGLWQPVGHADELLAANRAVLDDLDPTPWEGEVLDSVVDGRVAIGPGSRLESTIVRGPVVIGAGVELVHAYIGPYTALGDHVRIEGAEVEHSVIGEGADIRHLRSRIEASVVGREAKVFRDFSLPHAIRLRLSDGDEIRLH